MTTLNSLSPARAVELMRNGARLIDIRERDEHARERIPGAQNLPLSRFDSAAVSRAGGDIVIFHCRSGGRTHANAERLAAAMGGEAYFIEGGLQSWRAAGLPVIEDRKQPIEIMRQVQIAAGLLVVIGVTLGFALAPAFYTVAAFVGMGLVLAGLTGSCGMAKLLAWMPWNRRSVT